ncbi:MAG: hypothetical protein NO483_02525 [Candidatus Methanomethylicia archaeon]|nr:hypothetical protein [Candidatus Methanomethylicia archaeon]
MLSIVTVSTSPFLMASVALIFLERSVALSIIHKSVFSPFFVVSATVSKLPSFAIVTLIFVLSLSTSDSRVNSFFLSEYGNRSEILVSVPAVTSLSFF